MTDTTNSRDTPKQDITYTDTNFETVTSKKQQCSNVANLKTQFCSAAKIMPDHDDAYILCYTTPLQVLLPCNRTVMMKNIN